MVLLIQCNAISRSTQYQFHSRQVGYLIWFQISHEWTQISLHVIIPINFCHLNPSYKKKIGVGKLKSIIALWNWKYCSQEFCPHVGRKTDPYTLPHTHRNNKQTIPLCLCRTASSLLQFACGVRMCWIKRRLDIRCMIGRWLLLDGQPCLSVTVMPPVRCSDVSVLLVDCSHMSTFGK